MSTKPHWNLQKQLEMIRAIAAMRICRGNGVVQFERLEAAITTVI
jgi:hypothetical protein